MLLYGKSESFFIQSYFYQSNCKILLIYFSRFSHFDSSLLSNFYQLKVIKDNKYENPRKLICSPLELNSYQLCKSTKTSSIYIKSLYFVLNLKIFLQIKKKHLGSTYRVSFEPLNAEVTIFMSIVNFKGLPSLQLEYF